MTKTACALLLAALLVPQVSAQSWSVNPDHEMCDSDYGDRRYSEVREATLPAGSGVLRVDGGRNGGIRITGTDGHEVVVLAKVQVHGEGNRKDGRRLASAVEVLTDGNEIRATGPSGGRDWSVSYRIGVPRYSDLSLKTNNGGISISEVEGAIEFHAQNGGVHLDALAGDVRGMTQNGGLKVRLYGNEWIGEGLDVRTTNGGVKLRIPQDYSAELVTGTTNGKVRVDFPITVKGNLNKKIRATLGRGGARVSVTTTNGGVVVTAD